MAAAATLPAMNDGHKALHPFFNKTHVQAKPSEEKSESCAAAQPALSGSDGISSPADGVNCHPGLSSCRESVDGDAVQAGSTKGRGKGRGNGRTVISTSQEEVDNTEQADSTPEEQSEARRKRQRLSDDGSRIAASHVLQPAVLVPVSSPQPSAVVLQGQGSEDLIVHASSPPLPPSSSHNDTIVAPTTPPTNTHEPSPPSPRPQSHRSEGAPAQNPHPPATSAPRSPPKKMMRLKAGGRLVSPVKSDQSRDDGGSKQSAKGKRGGRKRKEKHLIAALHYSAESGIGDRIHCILVGLERYSPPSLIVKLSVKVPPMPLKPAMAAARKPTHPFFSGKPKAAPDPPSQAVNLSQSPRRPSAVTPGKLRAQRLQHKMEEGGIDESMTLTFNNNRDRLLSRQPGMTHAPWPSKGFAHVRGDTGNLLGRYCNTTDNMETLPNTARLSRKLKQRIPIVGNTDDLLTHYQHKLDFHQDTFVRPDGFSDPPPSLRVPDRHLLTGSQIQSLVSQRLPDSTVWHPACAALFDNIANLTPYDEGRSELHAWAQKYAPTSADQVLQVGREAFILREWMRALTIMTVDVTATRATKAAAVEGKPKKKRRKKADDLEGFVVNSDEEMNDMDELRMPDEVLSSNVERSQKASVVHTQGIDEKLSNALLISGPPGCGKSAMVYAVAKELGFEVFEINSGSRRSGRDVLDRVGDMVENHLVQRKATDIDNTSADEDAGRLSEAFKKDLASGRQGTMAGFFTSRPKNTQAARKKDPPKSNPAPGLQQKIVKSRSPRNQKQSLILLEEVDVLFEEDKGFWQTVFTLISNSKRPVIMTCNDEDLVPVQAMRLHAILRLPTPPLDLAVRYLELMAAKEGHLIGQDSISNLYKTKNNDLRASIVELQLWCQMGVGDPRGGLGWIYQRWPPGTGVGNDGQNLRVVSGGTYETGMGMVMHNADPSLHNSSKEEMLLQTWKDWNLDPRDKLFASSGSIADDVVITNDRDARMQALQDCEMLSRTLSDMDTFGCIDLPGTTRVDTTDPDISDKSRSSYISGMVLLQTPTIIDYSSTDTNLVVSCSYLASKVHGRNFDTFASTLVQDITGQADHAPLNRAKFSSALEALAYPCATNSFSLAPNLTWTNLDGPFKPITMDIAPYVRSIAAFDLALEAQRTRLAGQDPGGPKKMRTTRAARSALEGGQRSLTRRERWFEDTDLDLHAVLDTGGELWPRFIGEARSAELVEPW